MLKSADVAITTLQSIFIMSCIIGNSLVCAVIKRNQHLRIPINYLLVNLAVADIFFATFHATELVYNYIGIHPDGVAGEVACVFRNGALKWIAAFLSSFTVAAIAVERYYVVIRPLESQKKLSMQKVKVIIAVSWIASFVLDIPQFIRVSYKTDTWPKEWMAKVSFTVGFTVDMASFMLMVGVYSRIAYTLWFNRQDRNVLTPRQKGVFRVRKRVTLMVFIVSASFGICWATDNIMHTLEIFGSYNLGPYAIPIAHTTLVFNSALNPFAYALISQRFREKTKEMLCCSSGAKVRPFRKPTDVGVPHNTKQPITPC